jgi:uncharacterized membrane protein YeiH
MPSFHHISADQTELVPPKKHEKAGEGTFRPAGCIAVILYVLQLIGTAVFACSGALEAGRKRLDLVGVAAVSFVTAMGGGTVRDVLLDRETLLWTADPVYLYISVGAGLLTWALARIWVPSSRMLVLLDAGGLALFTISGVQVAEHEGASAVIALVMGLITGAAGGVFRDVLCGEIPLIFRASDLYVSASLLGGGAYLAAKALGLSIGASALLGATLIFLLRMAAVKWHWRLPVFSLSEKSVERE